MISIEPASCCLMAQGLKTRGFSITCCSIINAAELQLLKSEILYIRKKPTDGVL